MDCFRLVEYSSDEETSEVEDNDDENLKFSKKPKLENNENSENESLPLPLEIQNMYRDSKNEDKIDDSAMHGGKIRSFPHERGVWATYVFIHYETNPEFFEMLSNFQKIARSHGIDLDIPESFHVSLSKTVKLRHHWIQPFIDSLKVHLCTFYKFKLMFQSLEVYENDERTRTFLGLKVHVGFEHLLKLSKKVDMCLNEFQLPCFYENPSFHLSCASCVGNQSSVIETFMVDLNEMFQTFVESHMGCRTIWVSDIICKSGNKLFTIHLKS